MREQRCAECGEPTGEEYVEVRSHSPVHHDSYYFCRMSHAVEWANVESMADN